MSPSRSPSPNPPPRPVPPPLPPPPAQPRRRASPPGNHRPLAGGPELAPGDPRGRRGGIIRLSQDAPPDAHGMGDPRAAVAVSRPARRLGAAPHESMGPRLPEAHELPAVPYGPPAPQARRRPAAAPPPAHRARHGLPLSALRRA